MKVSYFTSLFKDYSIEDVAKLASQIGYDGLELQAPSHIPIDSSRKRVEEVKNIMSHYGLDVPAIFTKSGASYATAAEADSQIKLEEIKRFVEIANLLGVKMLVHSPGGPSPEQMTEEDYERAALWMSKAGEVCSQSGITIGMEIHHGHMTETLDGIDRLMNKMTQDNVGIVMDIGNLAIIGEEYGENAVHRIGKHLVHVHSNDVIFFDRKPTDRHSGQYRDRIFALELMGNGHVDPKPVYKALLQQGYAGYISLEARVKGVSPEDIAAHEYAAYQQSIKECQEALTL